MATIQGVYVALFGRPADPTGLAYFNTVTKNGADLSAIGDLSSTKEYQSRFGTQNNVQIITSIYQSLFAREPEPDGLEFFTLQLSNGNLNIKNIAIAILDGARGNDLTVVNNKIATANLFTQSLDTAVEVATYTGDAAAAVARNLLKEVTTTVKTQAEVNTAIASLVTADNLGNAKVAFADAAAENIVVGTGEKNTTDKNDTITGDATNWQPASDKVDGGFGVDTFNGTVAATGLSLGVDGLKSVEIVNLTATAASDINLANAKQATQVWNVAGTVTDQNLAVTGLALGTTVGVKGNVDGASSTFTFDGNSGTTDAVSLVLDAAVSTSTSGVVIAGIETLNVSNTGTSSVALTAADAKAVNVTGAGELTLTTAGAAQVAETFNASAFTGKLTATLSGETVLKSVIGGTGVDSITVDTNQTNDLTVSTGAGNDTITVATNTPAATAATKSVTLTGGAGNDLFSIAKVGNVQLVDTNANFIKTLVTITDFDKSSDVIKFDALSAATPLNNVIRGNISAATDLFEATKVAAAATNGGYTTFVYQGDAYLFAQSEAKDATGSNALTANDTLIKVTGISDLSAFTAANFIA